MSMKIDSHWLISISFRYNEKYWQKYIILEIPFPVHLSSSSSLDDCRVLPTCCCWQGSLRVSRQSAWRISRIPLTSWFTSSKHDHPCNSPRPSFTTIPRLRPDLHRRHRLVGNLLGKRLLVVVATLALAQSLFMSSAFSTAGWVIRSAGRNNLPTK